MRGPLGPGELPLSRSRAQRFDDLVRDEAARLVRRWGRELGAVEFVVEDVPAHAEPDVASPLSRTVPAPGSGIPRIVIYRRPVESRTRDEAERSLVVRALLVEEIADLLGLDPESVDPAYDPPDE